MRDLIPSPAIIDDLLAENWELRWQVLKILQQTQLILQNYAHSSREYKKALALCREMAGRLNGASDVNLHLVMTAAWFLGGSHFLLAALETIGVDDPETHNQEITKLKKPLSGNYSEASFFDYFHSLLSRNQAVDATTATAIKIFPPKLTLQLILSIPEPEVQRNALTQFKNQYPKTFFNDLLLQNGCSQIEEQPELLAFINGPLESELKSKIETLVASLLTTNSPAIEIAVQAAGHLQLHGCKPHLQQLVNELPTAAGALARLKDPIGCQKLIDNGKSWRRKKREAVLPELAWCPTTDAIELLQKRALQGKSEERRLALESLSEMRTPEALQALHNLLTKTDKEKDLKLVMQALSGPAWPGENRITADLLSQWSDQVALYPEILQALAALNYSDKWAKILQQTKSPVLQPHYREIALFMCRYADRYDIRRQLLTLINDIDWSFSYRLLNLLAPQFKSSDINILLNLLKDRDKKRELTIKERLTKGQDLEKVFAALAEFFLQNPEVADLTIRKIVTLAITGNAPTQTQLFASLIQQPAELVELILSQSESQKSSDPRDFYLLLTLHLLAEIEVDGSDCFAIVVHRTRRYSGFYREAIIAIIERLLETDGELDDTDSLAPLNQIIDAIRGQPYFSKLRARILKRINRITRNSRELIVFNEASQTRELRILKVKKLQ